MSTAARNAASISKCVVSSKCASGARLSGAVARIAPADIGEHVGVENALAGARKLGRAAARARFGRCSHEDLRLRVRKHDGADVAPVDHGAGRRAAELALEGEQRGAHLRYGGNEGRGLPHRMPLQRGLVEARGIERARRRDRRRHVIEPLRRFEHRLGDRAIDQPAVEVAQAVMPGKAFRERALARRRRAVDGNDHAGVRPLRARRRGRSSVKMFLERNSAGLANVRYSRMASASNGEVCQGRSR